MLVIRYLRSGKRSQAFFRIVLTDKRKPSKSGFLKVLGWYNPHTKEASLNKEEILKSLDNGAQASNSVAKLLGQNDIKHKSAVYTPQSPKAKKAKDEAKPKPAPIKDEQDSEKDTVAEASPESEQAKGQETPEATDENQNLSEQAAEENTAEKLKNEN